MPFGALWSTDSLPRDITYHVSPVSLGEVPCRPPLPRCGLLHRNLWMVPAQRDFPGWKPVKAHLRSLCVLLPPGGHVYFFDQPWNPYNPLNAPLSKNYPLFFLEEVKILTRTVYLTSPNSESENQRVISKCLWRCRNTHDSTLDLASLMEAQR